MDLNEIILWLFGGGTVFMFVISIALSILCTVLPVAGVLWFLYDRKKKADAIQQSSQTWATTRGIVIKSRVEVSGGEITNVNPKVVYEYEVSGKSYRGDQIRAGEKFWKVGTSQTAYDTIDRYPEGLEVTVYYNPANPAEATLER